MLQILLNLRGQDKITHSQGNCILRFPLDSLILVPVEKSQITNILSYYYGTDSYKIKEAWSEEEDVTHSRTIGNIVSFWDL